MAISALIAIPILFVLAHLFLGPGESWENILDHLLPLYLWNSLRVGLASLTLSILLGVTAAWIVSTYEFPLRKLFSWLFIVPLAIPVYIMGYAYAGLFDYSGFITSLIGVRVDVMNWWGLSLILGLALYPYVYLSTRAMFSLQNSRILEATSLLTKSYSKTFFKVALPLAIPAVAAGGSLVLMEVLNDYGAAKYFNVKTFSTGIFHSWFSLEEPNTAIFLAAILSVLIFVIIYCEKKFRERKRYASPMASSVRALQRLKPLNQVGLVLLSLIILLFALILPTGQLILWAMRTYSVVLDYEFFSIAWQSVSISLLSAFLCVLVALALISFTKWNRSKWVNKISKLTVLGYAIPGAVIAIGVFSPSLELDKILAKTWSQLSGQAPALLINGTILLLIYGYIIRFMAVAYAPLESGFTKVHKSLGESASLLGSSKLQTFYQIELPIIKYSLVGSALLVFVDIMKELPLTLILKPYSVNTLAVRAYEYASDERIAECACPALLIIAVGCIPIIFLNRIIK